MDTIGQLTALKEKVRAVQDEVREETTTLAEAVALMKKWGAYRIEEAMTSEARCRVLRADEVLE